jgi:ribonuclease HII
MTKTTTNITIGIDEVGRGPLAGPVAVGVFIIKPEKNGKTFQKLFRGVKESKQLSEEKREKWFSVIEEARDAGHIDFSVQFQSPKKIDALGLTRTINEAMRLGLEEIFKNHAAKNSKSKSGGTINYDDCLVLLDGGLRAPAHFKNQKTIIRGDEKKTAIALASICAKVLRDRRMKALAKKYPLYGFEIHKGYGTRAHCAAIRRHGPCPLHRKSFIKNLV